MSTRVLVIPEDFRKDQYVLKSLISAMLEYLNRPKARVQVCMDPLLMGIPQAMDRERLREIFDRYAGMVDLFLLCVDRDCEAGRRAALDNREAWAREECGCTLIAENAWQEIEVWVLAGHDLPQDWSWQEIRADCNPKETYFEPFVDQHGFTLSPGGGRKALAEKAARRYTRIQQLCPEDIGMLERRVGEALQQLAP